MKKDMLPVMTGIALVKWTRADNGLKTSQR